MGMMTFDLAIENREAKVTPAMGACPRDMKIHGMNGLLKRALDIAVASIALLYLAPLMLIVAIALKIEGGSVFYKQERVGRGGKRFAMWKFRSMHPNSDQLLLNLLATSKSAAQEWDLYQKLRNDPRITPIGNLIRKTSIDELPQLFNVIMGEMSVVGQRPILPHQTDTYGPHLPGYMRARPGITGLWQISGRSALTFEDRASIGSEYVNQWSLLRDFKILLLTIPVVLFSRDAY